MWRHVLLIGLLLGGAVPSGLSPVRSCFGASRPKLTARETAQLAAANALAKRFRTESKIPEAIAALGKVHQITAMFYGKDHWRTTDARLEIAHFRKRAALTPAQRKQLDETRRMIEKTIQLHKQGKFPEALKIAVGIPPILTRILGPQDPETLGSISDLGTLYLRMGRHAKALPLFRKNLNDKVKLVGLRHPGTTSSLSNLASTYQGMGQNAKALSLFQQGLEISISNHGPLHSKTLGFLRCVAHTYQLMGDYAKALPLFQRSLDDTRKTLGPMHPKTAGRLTDLARMHQRMGNYAKALPLYQQSVDISKATQDFFCKFSRVS